jgi:hypothetical protein
MRACGFVRCWLCNVWVKGRYRSTRRKRAPLLHPGHLRVHYGPLHGLHSAEFTSDALESLLIPTSFGLVDRFGLDRQDPSLIHRARFRSGMARHGPVWNGKVGRGWAGFGKVRQGMAWQGVER